MESRDFKNIKGNALNVNQNTKCIFDEDGRIHPRKYCWRLAKTDKYDDYETEPVDFQTVDLTNMDDISFEKALEHDDKWVFIEEAKNLQQIITDFMKHPVTPQKLYWEEKFNADLVHYNERWQNMQNMTEDTLIELNEASVNTTECETKYNEALLVLKDIEIESCPEWGPWQYGECSHTCGQGSKQVTRQCQLNGQPTVDEECKTEYPNDTRSITSEVCVLEPCEFSSWVVFGECTKACGGGKQQYTRTCPNGQCKQDGYGSRMLKLEDCNTHACEWSTWTTSSSCSVSCGGGTLPHRRKCIDRNTGKIGHTCEGDDLRIVNCNTSCCPGVLSYGEQGTVGKSAFDCGTYTRNCVCKSGKSATMKTPVYYDVGRAYCRGRGTSTHAQCTSFCSSC